MWNEAVSIQVKHPNHFGFTNDFHFVPIPQRPYTDVAFPTNGRDVNPWDEAVPPNEVTPIDKTKEKIEKISADTNICDFSYGKISSRKPSVSCGNDAPSAPERLASHQDVEVNVDDFMHIAIDEIKLEWSPDVATDIKPSTTQQMNPTGNSLWSPTKPRLESPLPELSSFLSNSLLCLQPLSPPPESPASENSSGNATTTNSPSLLLKLLNPDNSPPEAFQYNQWPVKTENPDWFSTSDNCSDGGALSQNISTNPQNINVREEESSRYGVLGHCTGQSGNSSLNRVQVHSDEVNVYESDNLSDVSWHESSDNDFDDAFEREEQMEDILRCYQTGGIHTNDNLIYCPPCDRKKDKDCREHGRLIRICDREIPMGIKNRAKKTLPQNLTILPSKIKGADDGVWTVKDIKKQSYFGPYQGVVVPMDHQNTDYCWRISQYGKRDFLIDGSDLGKSNWMRYVNCARTSEEQNLEAYQFRGEIYYRTTRDISRHEELLVWYGFRSARSLGIKWNDFVESRLPCKRGVVFSCDQCFHSYSNPVILEHHKKYCKRSKKDDLNPNETPAKTQASPSSIHAEHPPTFMEVTTGDKPVTCGVCGARFHQRGRSLLKHMTSHNEETHNCCLKCGRWFPDQDSVRKHTTDVLESRRRGEDIICIRKSYDCHVCKSQFYSKEARKRHMKKRIKNIQKAKSDEISQKGDTLTVLKSRERRPSLTIMQNLKSKNSKSLEASKHDTPFSEEGKLPRKMPTKHVLCEKCGMTFWRKSAFELHLEKAHEVRSDEKEQFAKNCSPRRFKCRECGVLYREKSTLLRHLTIHETESVSENEEPGESNDEKRFTCKKCGMEFRAAVTLQYHMDVHSQRNEKQSSEKRYKCKLCSARFKARITLEEHKKMHDPLADKTPLEMVSRDAHLTSGPTQGKPYPETPSCDRKRKSVNSSYSEVDSRVSEKSDKKDEELSKLRGKSSESGMGRPIKLGDGWENSERDDSKSELQAKKKRRRISSFECLACGFIFRDRPALDAHVLKHIQGKQLFCDLSSVRIPN